MPRPQTTSADREGLSRSTQGAVAIIPARLQSTRLPEKALQDLGGVPLIVTYHPAYLLRNLPDKQKAWEDLLFARRTLLDAAQAAAVSGAH